MDFDEIRKQVAIKHNVLLGKDDPVLVTVTINELVLNEYAQALAQQQKQASKELAVSLEHHIQQSKDTAGKLITQAADYVNEQVKASMDAALAQINKQLDEKIRRIQAAQPSLSEDEQKTRRIAFWALIIGIGAAIIGLMTFLAIMLKH